MKPISFAGACLALSLSLHAQAAPLALGKPGWRVLQASPGADGTLCLAGQAADPQGEGRTRGVLVLVSLAREQVLWQQEVDAPDAGAQLAFVGCHADGSTLYAAANAQVGGQARAYAYRFDEGGRVAGVKRLDSGPGEAWAYGIGGDAGGVVVAGMARETQGQEEANGIFFARLDPALRDAAIERLSSGAYLPGAAVRLGGNTMLVGGNFAAAHSARGTPADDHAVSKLVGGKYRFSLRPLKLPAADVATAISSAGELVSLGHAGKTSWLATIGADGKPRDRLQFPSTFCATGSMSADASAVYAVRALCGKEKEPAVLVAIDRRTGAEELVSGIVGEPVYVLALGPKLAVVARRSNGSLLLQTVVKGQDPDA